MHTRWSVVRRLALAALTLMALVLSAGVAAQEGVPLPNPGLAKYALVIGNGNYVGNRRSLKNPLNDSKLMAQSLRQLGFKVKLVTDLERTRMLSTVAEFADALPQGATALVYYAGHGMQLGGASYLLPVDMVLTSEHAAPLRAYPLRTLLERLSASKSAVNIVVLDACRDNPFQPEAPIKYRSYGNLGLAAVQAPVGTLVAYSTSPGQLAADGQSGNSIYTAALAQLILEPHLPIETIFRKVGVQVRNKTEDDQIPWFESSLSDAYYFQPPDGVTMVAGRSQAGSGDGQADKSRRRDGSQAAARIDPALWYLNRSEADWLQTDQDIERRVHAMTAADLAWVEHLAEGGNLVAQTVLGLYPHSEPASARAWLRKAANAAFPVAQTALARLYLDGHGVAPNASMARHLLEQAALAHYPRAQQLLDSVQ